MNKNNEKKSLNYAVFFLTLSANKKKSFTDF